MHSIYDVCVCVQRFCDSDFRHHTTYRRRVYVFTGCFFSWKTKSEYIRIRRLLMMMIPRKNGFNLPSTSFKFNCKCTCTYSTNALTTKATMLEQAERQQHPITDTERQRNSECLFTNCIILRLIS